jgi:hypothetical protein
VATDPAILFVKPKAISAADKDALQKAGVIVIEIDDPQAVKLVRAHAEIPQSALLGAAASAISSPGTSASTTRDVEVAFARNVCAAIAAMQAAGKD